MPSDKRTTRIADIDVETMPPVDTGRGCRIRFSAQNDQRATFIRTELNRILEHNDYDTRGSIDTDGTVEFSAGGMQVSMIGGQPSAKVVTLKILEHAVGMLAKKYHNPEQLDAAMTVAAASVNATAERSYKAEQLQKARALLPVDRVQELIWAAVNDRIRGNDDEPSALLSSSEWKDALQSAAEAIQAELAQKLSKTRKL